MVTNREPANIIDARRCVPMYRALSTAALVVAVLFSGSLYAQDLLPVATYNFNSSEKDSVHVSTVHNYESEADRANDALLITEVKKALADDGVTANRAVVVDCDHGTVSLDGIVGSAADARRAATVARNVEGVVAVKNNLKWPPGSP
jgi:osmotically-inducible protein OsmY